MEIGTVALTRLRNEEHYKFNLDFQDLVNQYPEATSGVQPLFEPFQKVFAVEALALNVLRSSAITDDLVVADDRRDSIYSGVAGTIRSALNHFKPEIRAAAARLQKLFDSYGNISEKPYDQETAAIYKLVEELQSHYRADVATLGITEWVEELARLNKAFDTLKNERYTEEVVKPQQNLKLARIETDKAYRAIVKRINALIEVNGDTAYAGFVAELNQRIENYQIVLAQRQGRNAKEGGAKVNEQIPNQ